VTLKKLGAAFAVITLTALATPKSASAAIVIGFDCITNNSGSCNSFEGDLSGLITVSGASLSLTVSNAPAGTGSIEAIYADGNVLTGLTSIIDSPPNVDFASGGAPPDLPGNETVVPSFDADFWATSTSAFPGVDEGVNGGESVTLVFSLSSSQTEAQIQALLDSGALRFGLHVQSLGAGQNSESFVNDGPPTAVPEPASMLLLGTGLLVAARARRRKTS
jgi:hypothetical protein